MSCRVLVLRPGYTSFSTFCSILRTVECASLSKYTPLAVCVELSHYLVDLVLQVLKSFAHTLLYAYHSHGHKNGAARGLCAWTPSWWSQLRHTRTVRAPSWKEGPKYTLGFRKVFMCVGCRKIRTRLWFILGISICLRWSDHKCSAKEFSITPGINMHDLVTGFVEGRLVISWIHQCHCMLMKRKIGTLKLRSH